MDIDSELCDIRCFICGDPCTEDQTLSKVTQKGYPQFLYNSEIVSDTAILTRLHEDWNSGVNSNLKYHIACKSELNNKARAICTEKREYVKLVFNN